ncbi:DNA-directed RNA polymerase II [Micromonosporaceae bacterium Da 78-11]
MPEQPQWSERTLDMPPQDPWADPPAAPYGSAGPQSYGPPHAPNHPQSPAQPPGSAAQPPGSAARPPSSTQSRGPAPQSPANKQVQSQNPAHTQVQPPAAAAPPSPFTQGRAQVSPRTSDNFAAEHEPTGTGWPGAQPPVAHPGMSWRWSELRRGGEWATAAFLFLFVCWGIWAISSTGSTMTAVIVFIVTLVVAGGVFCLSRVVGHLVLERVLGRTRRTARGSHLVTALFLVGVGIGHLQQTQWVMDAFNWVRDLAA